VKPLWRSARASVSPPIPPPTISTLSTARMLFSYGLPRA
jgi:hypothetical protein